MKFSNVHLKKEHSKIAMCPSPALIDVESVPSSFICTTTHIHFPFPELF